MRSTLLGLSLIFAAMPAFAGGFSIDLPNLTWPTTDGVTVSTSGCDQAVVTPTAGAPSCK